MHPREARLPAAIIAYEALRSKSQDDGSTEDTWRVSTILDALRRQKAPGNKLKREEEVKSAADFWSSPGAGFRV